MRKRYIIPLIILGAIVLISLLKMMASHNEPKPELAFDKSKWETREKATYPYRDAMLKDLFDNQKLKYLKEKEVLDMLGEPNRKDGEYLFYQINQTRFILFPLHTKTLVIKLSADSTANRVMIHE